MTTETPVEYRQSASRLASGARWRLDPRNNSLNLIRLVLAAAVLVSHAFPLAGQGEGPRLAGETLGGWAVIGFFAISGYLITGSRLRTAFGEYLTHRIARIFPAFLVCLVVTALAFAPVSYFRANGSLSGFFSTPNTPINYVFANSLLRMNDYSIAGTPSGVPYPGAWNGSLWTLYYEFLCYLIVGILACLVVVRRSPWGIAVAFVVSVLVQANLGTVLEYTGHNQDVIFLAKLLPYFLGGALVFMLKKWIPLTWPIAVSSFVVAGTTVLVWNDWGGQAAAPLFAVALLWLGSVIPAPVWTQRNDISYGLYVYAFPVQQLLATFGVHEHGMWIYILAAFPPTVALAMLSWFGVERPVMRRVRRTPRPAQAAEPATRTPGGTTA